MSFLPEAWTHQGELLCLEAPARSVCAASGAGYRVTLEFGQCDQFKCRLVCHGAPGAPRVNRLELCIPEDVPVYAFDDDGDEAVDLTVFSEWYDDVVQTESSDSAPVGPRQVSDVVQTESSDSAPVGSTCGHVSAVTSVISFDPRDSSGG